MSEFEFHIAFYIWTFVVFIIGVILGIGFGRATR